MTTHTTDSTRIHADHTVVKRLGHWTTATDIELRVRRSVVVVDLRSPQISGDITLNVDLERSTLTLLLPDDAEIDQWDLRWEGAGRLSDDQPGSGARRVRLVGAAAGSRIRVRRAGAAQVTAMLSREYLADLRRARREGTLPVLDDPTRA